MCDCNFFCKILCTIILIFAFLINSVGNWVGVGDIIPTDACPLNCGCEETTTETSTELITDITEEHTTVPTTTTTKPTTTTTTSPATTTTTKPTTTTTTAAPTTTTTTAPITTTTTTRKETTKPPETDAGPHILTAEQTSLSVLGGSDDDIINGIAPLNDGGYIVCGVTNSEDGNFESVYTNTKWKKPYSFVARYSKTGTRRWIKVFASTSSGVTLEDIAVLSDGTFVAVGYSNATDYAANDKSSGTYDAIILRLASNGSLKSKKSFGGDKSDMFYCVTATENGFAVGGKSYSKTGDFADLPGQSAILINFDLNTNILWKKYLHGNASSSIDGITCDENGNIFATCLTAATTGDFSVFDKLIGGYTDTVVLKYDSEGTYQWGFPISSSGRDEFSAITPDGNGGCVVGGNYELIPSNFPDGTIKDVHHCGGIDALVFRINANGTQRWCKTLSGIYDDFITDVVKTDGGFAISGYSASSNREFQTCGNEGGYDGFTSFVNTNGVTVNTLTHAGTQNDMASCIVYTKNGEIVTAGKTQSTDIDFADLNTYSTTVYLAYMAKYQITVG